MTADQDAEITRLREDLEDATADRDRLNALLRSSQRFYDEYIALLREGLDTAAYYSDRMDAILKNRNPDAIRRPSPRVTRGPGEEPEARALDLLAAALECIAARDGITRAEALRAVMGESQGPEIAALIRRLEEAEAPAPPRKRGRPRRTVSV